MITYPEALASYARHTPRLSITTSLLQDALGQTLAADLCAPYNAPAQPTSAMDGWAVRAADTTDPPRCLEIIGELWAGQDPRALRVGPGHAVRIATGAMLPEGADAIVRSEDASHTSSKITLNAAISSGRDVRAAGEQLQQGALIARAGARLTPGMIAALAMQGITHVEVFAKPRVELLTCGDELITPGAHKEPWQHFEGNSAMILAHLSTLPVDLVAWTHMPDQDDAILSALTRAQDRADLLITTGGASVGVRDLWRANGARLNAQEHFWRVAQRPGKPMFFSTLGTSCAWLGLPGTPHAVLTALATHLPALLNATTGHDAPQASTPLHLPLLKDADAHPTMTRHELARLDSCDSCDSCDTSAGVTLLGQLPLHVQMAQAQVVAIIPAGQSIAAGQLARVLPLYPC